MNEMLNIYEREIQNKKTVQRETIIKIAQSMNVYVLMKAVVASRLEYPSLTDTLVSVLEDRMKNATEQELADFSAAAEIINPSPTPPLEETRKESGDSEAVLCDGGEGTREIDIPKTRRYSNWLPFALSLGTAAIVALALTWLYLVIK